jgi:hypothetical protein
MQIELAIHHAVLDLVEPLFEKTDRIKYNICTITIKVMSNSMVKKIIFPVKISLVKQLHRYALCCLQTKHLQSI